MADYTLFPAKVVTPEGVAFDGQVQEIEVTSTAGGLGILARRAPVVADLRMGRIRALLEDGTWQVWASSEGFAQASNSTATIVVEEAVVSTEIDTTEAAALVSAGQARLERAGGDVSEVLAAERAIAWGEHLLSFNGSGQA